MPYEIGGSDIRASDTSLAVPVRHAADVEIDETPLPDGPSSAEVEVRVLLAEQDSAGSVQFDGVLPSPSGQLLIGDAESERAVTVPAGMVRIRVRLEPAEHAEVVTLYIGRAQDDWSTG